MSRSLLLTLTVSLLPATLATATANATANWKSIRIGGGGYVPGTFFSSAPDANAYFKTDVGGIYRRNINSSVPGGIEWIPLLDALTSDQSTYYSVSHLALHPSNGSSLYALLGSEPSWGPCRVAHSDDGGGTWTNLIPGPGNWTLGCGGNVGDRGVGDRLVIHPQDEKTLMIAGYDGRVYITNDGFSSGAAGVANISLPGVNYPTPSTPVRTLSFVPLSLGASPPVAAVAALPGLGLWWSQTPPYTDPSSWSFVPGSDSLGNVSRLLVDPLGPHLYSSSTSGFARMTASSSAGLTVDWQVRPNDTLTYDGLAFNPAYPSDITFVSISYASDTTFRRTLDGGKTFFVVNWTTSSMVPWATDNAYGMQLNALASFNYDPFASTPGYPTTSSSQVWASDFFGVWKSEDWDAPAAAAKAGGDPSSVQVHFRNVEWGHEEVCVNFVKGPPNGNVFSGVADDFGWVHDQGLDQYPSRIYGTKDDHNLGFGADYTLSTTATGPNGSIVQEALWVAAGDEYGATRNGWSGTHHWVGVSNDGGVTFKETAYDSSIQGSNTMPYRIVTHPFNGSIAVIVGYSGTPVVYTHDAGDSWFNATNDASNSPLSSVGPWGNFWWALPLVRDQNADAVGSPTTPATFYYYNGTSTLFQSIDNGASWSTIFTKFPVWDVPLFAIATPPRGTSAAGDIWAFAGWQLHHSVNGGLNFSEVYQFYSVKSTIATGPLPAAVSSKTGKSAADMSAMCATHRVPEEMRPRAAPAALHAADAAAGRVPAYPTSTAGPSYVLYVVGTQTAAPRVGVYASIDYGATYIELTNAAQGLGDSPSVVDVSMSSPGTIFVGTDGRGAFYADVSALLMQGLEECEAEALEAGAVYA